MATALFATPRVALLRSHSMNDSGNKQDMFLIWCLLVAAGKTQENAPQDAWKSALMLATSQSLKTLLIVVADKNVSVDWPSFLEVAPSVMLFSEVSLVPETETESFPGLLLASTPGKLSRALASLRMVSCGVDYAIQ
ncbi:uncharacterized protein LOC144097926 [Amblyomma americanum]